MIYKVVLVSDVQQSDSVINKYASILFQILFNVVTLSVIQVTLSVKVPGEKVQLNHKEWSRTLKLETAGAVTPLNRLCDQNLETKGMWYSWDERTFLKKWKHTMFQVYSKVIKL